MAAREPSGWCLNREIAAELSLPPQYLTKLLRVLAAQGILESQRGRLGGFRLARPASKITLLEIVDPFDQLSEHRACLLGQETCSDEMSCPLHDQWSRISDSLRRALRGWTLAQLKSEESASGFPRLVRTGLESAGREKPPRGPSKRGKPGRKPAKPRGASRGSATKKARDR